jgi:hypothetical protein
LGLQVRFAIGAEYGAYSTPGGAGQLVFLAIALLEC